MPFAPAYGRGRGGGGALIVAERSDNNNPAVFANFAALETYTATTAGTADAARINVATASSATEVFAVGTLTAGNDVQVITAAYIRVLGDWIAVATNLVGTPGQDGSAGADALDIQFVSEAARDTYFAGKPTALKTGLPILVTDASDPTSNVVKQQVWDGADMPTSYTPATDAVFWSAATIRADTSSFELGDVHKITSGGENVYFENQDSDVNYFPPWQAVGDHRTLAGRTVQNRPTSRTYGDLQSEQFGGAVATSGAADYNTLFTLPANESVHGVQVIPAEDYDGEITYRVTRIRTGGNLVVYNHTQSVDTTIGTALDLWFEVPLDGRSGAQTRVQLVKPDGTFLSVRPTASDSTDPWTQVQVRNFTDDGLAYESELFSKPRQSVRTSTSLTINSTNVAQFQPSGVIEFTNESGQVNLTLAEDTFTVGDELQVKHYSIGGIPSAGVLIAQQGTGGRIDAEIDIELAMDSAITMRYVATNLWRIVSSYNMVSTTSTEQTQDIVGAMVTGNTETGISVTYDDTEGKLNFAATGVTVTDEHIQDVIGAMVSGNTETGINVTYDDNDGTLDFVLDSTATPVPSLHNLAINIPSRVDLSTDLNNTRTITYGVTNYSGLSALELIVNNGTNQTVSVPVRDGEQTATVTLAGINTASTGTVTFQLSGTAGTQTITSNIVTVTVRDLQAQELTYVGAQADTAPTNFDTANANSSEYQNSQTVTIPTFTGSRYIGIAQPLAEPDITSINIGGLEQVSTFTKATGDFSIGGIAYEFYYSNNTLLGSVVSGVTMNITRG